MYCYNYNEHLSYWLLTNICLDKISIEVLDQLVLNTSIFLNDTNKIIVLNIINSNGFVIYLMEL